MLKCECKGKIAPTTTLFGEKYLEKHTKAIKDAIFIEKDDEVKLNTHCNNFLTIFYLNESSAPNSKLPDSAAFP